jgi:hypothetical protein
VRYITRLNWCYAHRPRTNYSSTNDPKIRQEQRQQIREQISQKIKELRLYKDRLSENAEAWKIFKQTELQCFNDIEDVLGPSFDAINKAFSNLEDARRRVVDMIEELCQDYPQGVSHNIWL